MEDMAIRGPRKRRRPWTTCSRTAPVTTPTVDTGTDGRSSAGADWPHTRQARSSRLPGARYGCGRCGCGREAVPAVTWRPDTTGLLACDLAAGDGRWRWGTDQPGLSRPWMVAV